MAHDIVSDALNQIMNAKKSGKDRVKIHRISKFLVHLLEIMKKDKYIDFSVNGKNAEITILKLNECKAIKPRYNVSVANIEKYLRRYLPSRNFGVLVISTNQGLKRNEECEEKKLGGSIIAYYY